MDHCSNKKNNEHYGTGENNEVNFTLNALLFLNTALFFISYCVKQGKWLLNIKSSVAKEQNESVNVSSQFSGTLDKCIFLGDLQESVFFFFYYYRASKEMKHTLSW